VHRINHAVETALAFIEPPRPAIAAFPRFFYAIQVGPQDGGFVLVFDGPEPVDEIAAVRVQPGVADSSAEASPHTCTQKTSSQRDLFMVAPFPTKSCSEYNIAAAPAKAGGEGMCPVS
jgi:hypothetical protein